MQALILAAGLGSRLRPLTDITPKCLVEIKGKKLLEIWLEKLEKAGVDSFIINTHHLSEKVEDFIQKSRFKNKVKIVYEKKLLGTAGTLYNNIEDIKDELIFLHADNFTNDDLRMLVSSHSTRSANCLMTMLTFTTDNPNSCGIIKIDSNNIMLDFVEKPSKYIGSKANAAIYILSKEFIDEFKTKHKNSYDFSIDVIPKFKNRILTSQTNSFFIDIGNYENLYLANNHK